MSLRRNKLTEEEIVDRAEGKDLRARKRFYSYLELLRWERTDPEPLMTW